VLLDVKAIDGNAVRVSATAPVNTAPFRKHQYRPAGTREWYVVQKTDGYVWRVEDNSEDVLYLTADDLILFSDRFMIDLTEDADLDEDFGFRFLRISIGDAATPTLLRVPADQRFLKIGRIEFGTLEVVSNPEWGFSKRIVPNVALAVGSAGTRRAKRLGPELEEWSMEWPTLPADRLDDTRYLGDTDLWQQVVEQLMATGLGLRTLVMVHDPYDIDDADWLRVTGMDMTLGRITGAIDVRHQVYMGIEDCGTLTERVGVAAALGGVVFTEEP